CLQQKALPLYTS
nr:immunoglobulin light chain junction region [Macaca mulatta]